MSGEKKGFASMPKENVKEISSKGGHGSNEKGEHKSTAEKSSKGGHSSSGSKGQKRQDDDAADMDTNE
jgi:hypothetical protein